MRKGNALTSQDRILHQDTQSLRQELEGLKSRLQAAERYNANSIGRNAVGEIASPTNVELYSKRARLQKRSAEQMRKHGYGHLETQNVLRELEEISRALADENARFVSALRLNIGRIEQQLKACEHPDASGTTPLVLGNPLSLDLPTATMATGLGESVVTQLQGDELGNAMASAPSGDDRAEEHIEPTRQAADDAQAFQNPEPPSAAEMASRLRPIPKASAQSSYVIEPKDNSRSDQGADRERNRPAPYLDGKQFDFPDIHAIVEILHRRFAIALTLSAIVFVAIIVVSLQQPNVYTAHSDVMFNLRQPDIVDIDEVLTSAPLWHDAVDSELEVIRSRDLLRTGRR